MDIKRLEVAEALKSLNTSPAGLGGEEIARRRTEFGPNRIEAVRGDPVWLRLAREFTHFFALILWLAAALAFIADAYEPGAGMRQLGWAIVGVIVVNGIFSFWQEYRAEKAVEALRNLLPQQVDVLRDGVETTVNAEELVPGDIVRLEEGNKVPADCRLIEGSGLRANISTLTGESDAVARNAKPADTDDPLQARNLLLAGTLIVGGQCHAVVYATGMHTEFGKIAHLTQTVRVTITPLQREIARLSRLIAMLAMGLGVIFFFIGQALALPLWDNFMFAIGIIVANVPEGLLPTVTLSLAMATQRMAKRNALVRHLPAVETLGSTTVICSDKTGTLTQNHMTVRQVFTDNALRSADTLAGEGVRSELRAVAGYCHSLKFPNGGDAPLGDAMEIALYQFAWNGRKDVTGGVRAAELPFDADRKRMSVVIELQGHRTLYCKGAPEALLAICDCVLIDGETRPLDTQARQLVIDAQNRMAETGLRVLALAFRPLAAAEQGTEEQLVICGLIGLEDPPRPEVLAAAARCRDAGVKVIMVTGDYPHTAVAIAREIGIVRSADPVVLRGDQIAKMTPAQLQIALDAPEILFARVTAVQKMLIVQALQRKGEIVAVTGDGVNDAPALKAADIGIAMGLSGTDVAKEAADIILLDDNFASIVNAIEEGRAVFANIRKFLTYILTSNVPELIPYLAFVLFRIPLPLTIIQILAVDLGTDMVPALALGAESPDAGLMRQPPRARGERLLNWPLAIRAYLFLGLLEAAAAMAAFFYVLREAGWHYGVSLAKNDPMYLQATTACLAAIVLAQVCNVFLCRHPRQSALRFGLLDNPLLVGGIAFELLLIGLIVYTPWGNALFGTQPLPLNAWLAMVPFVAGMFVLEEGRKWLVRRRQPKGANTN